MVKILYFRKHKKHKSKHHKEEEEEVIDCEVKEILQTVELKASSEKTIKSNRGVEIKKSSTSNGIMELMQIVVSNENGNKHQVGLNDNHSICILYYTIA